MPEKQQLITKKIRSYIGKVNQPITSWAEVTKTEIRRLIQAIPDEDPLYYDEDYARKTKFGGVVAPPSLPQFMIGIRRPGTRDPLIDMPDDRGLDSPVEGTEPDEEPRYPGLFEVLAHFPKDMRIFHGGDEFEVYRLARPGDRITCSSKVADIYEKSGGSGCLVFVVTELTYRDQRGELLCINRNIHLLMEQSTQESEQ